MAKSFGKNEKTVNVGFRQGYFMYSDGYSYWGIPLLRNGEMPKACTATEHNMKELKDKVDWYNN